MSDAGHATPRPLSVLQVCSIKSRGGTGYMMSRMARLLHRAGHRVRVGALPGSKVVKRAIEDGIPLLEGLGLRRGFRPLTLRRDVRLLRECIRRDGVDLVHAWHSIEYWTCALAVAGTGARLVRTRGLVLPVAAHPVNRFLHRRTAAVVVTCRKIEAIYRDAGLSMDNVYLMRDGVDTERFRPGRDGTAVRREAGIPEDVPLAANVGRMMSVKDQHTFLRALALLPPPVHGCIAGDGPLRDELEGEAKRLGVADRVRFLGVRADIEDILAASDLYVLCSVGSEGSSRATLEAMASGLPVVTTTVGMLPDIVKPGVTGVLVPPGDPDELAACMADLLNDRRLRQRLGEKARAFVEERHSETAMLRSVESIYVAALGMAAPAAEAGASPPA